MPRNPKQDANLRHFGELPPEERRALASKGGKAGQAKRKERLAFQDVVLGLLDKPALKPDGQPIRTPDGEILPDMRAAVVAATLRSALKGDVKAAAQILEWAGEVGQKAEVENNIIINVSES